MTTPTTTIISTTVKPIVYPDSDGQPMADNTKQFEEICALKLGCEAEFATRDNVFVAGDLLWYPLQGQPTVRQAPDVLIAFGRPRGNRGSYKQWEEGNIAPQVVFEILSPGNRFGEMLRKLEFYERHGVQEYYVYDPDSFEFTVFWRSPEDRLVLQEETTNLTSPLLGLRFEAPGDAPWTIHHSDGERLKRYDELRTERNALREQVEHLQARLRALGIDPENP
ncbi:Uma2 family endonuclease [Armatimonas sp.]|uniref:Uma2 family endonuclease n=1 Tax=Armatimonas sp. TaxID=1872638 RepID=UPI00286B74F6|nr:Uma2 family endonuclease [Armatimonas sp.]